MPGALFFRLAKNEYATVATRYTDHGLIHRHGQGLDFHITGIGGLDTIQHIFHRNGIEHNVLSIIVRVLELVLGQESLDRLIYLEKNRRDKSSGMHHENTESIKYLHHIGNIGVVHILSEVCGLIRLIDFQIGTAQVHGIRMLGIVVIDGRSGYHELTTGLDGILRTVAGNGIDHGKDDAVVLGQLLGESVFTCYVGMCGKTESDTIGIDHLIAIIVYDEVLIRVHHLPVVGLSIEKYFFEQQTGRADLRHNEWKLQGSILCDGIVFLDGNDTVVPYFATYRNRIYTGIQTKRANTGFVELFFYFLLGTKIEEFDGYTFETLYRTAFR